MEIHWKGSWVQFQRGCGTLELNWKREREAWLRPLWCQRSSRRGRVCAAQLRTVIGRAAQATSWLPFLSEGVGFILPRAEMRLCRRTWLWETCRLTVLGIRNAIQLCILRGITNKNNMSDSSRKRAHPSSTLGFSFERMSNELSLLSVFLLETCII